MNEYMCYVGHVVYIVAASISFRIIQRGVSIEQEDSKSIFVADA